MKNAVKHDFIPTDFRRDFRADSRIRTRIAGIYSAATISLVLKGRYAGDLSAVERTFNGCFKNALLICPVLGELSVDRCIRYQKQKFSAVNPQRVALYKACRNGCPHFKKGE